MSSNASSANLRRSRAIKVKSGRGVSGKFDTNEKNKNLKVADRVKVFNTLDSPSNTKERTQDPGRGNANTWSKSHTDVNPQQGHEVTGLRVDGRDDVTGSRVNRRHNVKDSSSRENNVAGLHGLGGLKPVGNRVVDACKQTVDNKDSVKTAVQVKIRTWEKEKQKEGDRTFDFLHKSIKNDLVDRLNPKPRDVDKIPPPLSPKPKPRHHSKETVQSGSGDSGELGLKCQDVRKKHPPISPKPSVNQGAQGHPPVISPKPKSVLSQSNGKSEGSGSLKTSPHSKDVLEKDVIGRSWSTNSGSHSDRGGCVKRTKDSGYGSSPSVSAEHMVEAEPQTVIGSFKKDKASNKNGEAELQAVISGLRRGKGGHKDGEEEPETVIGGFRIDKAGHKDGEAELKTVIGGLRRVKTSGLCQSIENLDDDQCFVENVSGDRLLHNFESSDAKYEDFCQDSDYPGDSDAGIRKEISKRGDVTESPANAVYISCIEDETDSQNEEHRLYRNMVGYPGLGQGDAVEAPSHMTDSQIYESVRAQQDQDFSDWSDFDDSDEFDEFTDTEDDFESSADEIDAELLAERRKEKLYCIVEELKDTEVTYVYKLQLLAEARECAESKIKEDSNFLFPYIQEIHKLHKENFLPKLKHTIKNWEENHYIGNIMKGFAPFLKIYTDYVKNFERVNGMIETWLAKSPTFRAKVQQICEKYSNRHSWVKLDIKAHMLEPVQRVPRYKLLLTDYLKRLPADCDPQELMDVRDALKMVSEAAQHFELTINQKTEFGELVMLDGLIQSPVPILGSDRKLLKQGTIQKYCVRTDRHDPRYLFLFSDILLVCKEYPLKLSGPKYHARQVLHVQDMQVLEGSKLDHELAFVVKTKEKNIEFLAESENTKIDWQQALWQVIGTRSRESSRNNSTKEAHTELTDSQVESVSDRQPLGQVAPLWVKNNEVTMCMVCTSDFSTFLRRHHCRACGCIVCSKCSSHTWKLEYADTVEQRICDNCYQRLMEECVDSVAKTRTIRAASKQKKRFRELCLQWGYIQLSSNEGRSWQKVYVEIHEGGMMFVYKASQNPKPEWSADLGGAGVKADIQNDTPVLIVTLHEGKSYLLKGVFKEHTTEELYRWSEAIDRAIQDGGFRHSRTSSMDKDQTAETLDNNNATEDTASSELFTTYDVITSHSVSSTDSHKLSTTTSDNDQELDDNIYETVASPNLQHQEESRDRVWSDDSFSSEYEDYSEGNIVINESNC